MQLHHSPPCSRCPKGISRTPQFEEVQPKHQGYLRRSADRRLPHRPGSSVRLIANGPGYFLDKQSRFKLTEPYLATNVGIHGLQLARNAIEQMMIRSFSADD